MELIDKVDILIVDDRLDGLIALEAVLRFPNASLVRAQSGQEALNLLPQYEFAVILLDVQMPEMDGFETAARIRQTDKHAHTPIIFVTAINKDDSYIYKGYEAGAVDYIFKPFEPHILRSKVSVFIELFIQSKQLQAQAEFIRESERRERYLKLAELEVESLKRYRNLADSIPHLVWRAHLDGTLEYFNKVWTDYTGLSQEQSAGIGWQAAVEPGDLKEFLKAWIWAMDGKTPFEMECRLRRADGEMRWHSMRVVPDLRRNDEVIAWLGTCTDIDERKKMETRLIQTEKLAVSASVAKTHFLANMSHEIRTPLGVILGFTELMMDPMQSHSEQINCISTIRRSGRQLLEIIDEILDISKVEAGRLEIEKLDINTSLLFGELQSMLLVNAQKKKLGLKLRLTTPIPSVIHSDPTRIRQILLNMIGNAIKFTENGGITIDVSWHPESAGRPARLQVRVSDTGIGIDMSEADRLFQPFVQMDNSTTRRFGGTGLGLALSRQLARALGGDVVLENSRPTLGSTFLIEIEADLLRYSSMITNLDQPSDEKNRPPERDASILSGMRILVVDDAADNQILISKFLTNAGAIVEVASNGNEGVQKAMSTNFQVVLMDIQMPQLDGYEATTLLRQKGYTKPIIALTAHALKEEHERCMSVGCTEHLTKPIDRRQLISQVAKVVGQFDLH